MVTCRWEPHGGSQTLQERQAGHTQHCTRSGGPRCPWGPKLEGLHSARPFSFEWLGRSMEPMNTVRDAYRGILLRQHVGDPHNVAARSASTMRTPCAFSRLWFGPMEPKYKPDPVHVLGDPAAKRCWRMQSLGAVGWLPYAPAVIDTFPRIFSKDGLAISTSVVAWTWLAWTLQLKQA